MFAFGSFLQSLFFSHLFWRGRRNKRGRRKNFFLLLSFNQPNHWRWLKFSGMIRFLYENEGKEVIPASQKFFFWKLHTLYINLLSKKINIIFDINLNLKTTFNNGSLGSRIDEERSEMRYVMWIAEFSESSNLWTHLALSGIPESIPISVSVYSSIPKIWFNFLYLLGIGIWALLCMWVALWKILS